MSHIRRLRRKVSKKYLINKDDILIKNAEAKDIDNAMQIINQAKEYLKSKNIDQWQDGYPDLKCIQTDIENKRGYVLVSNGIIIGYLCIDFDGDPAYQNLNGNWKGDQNYAVIHRMAISNAFMGNGISNVVFELVSELCKQNLIYSIRIDTDDTNSKMKYILNKNGFEYCGTVLFDDSEKIAFEKLLN